MTTCYITTPIYYVNDRPHIGHCYTTTLADVAARFQRLFGRDVLMLTGTDEHADKVVAKALERSMTPRQWADACSAEFVKAFNLLNLRFDIFYRTSDQRHKDLAQSYIRQLQAKGDIYLGDYVGWYDASQDEYLTDTLAKEHNYLSPVTKKPLEKRTEKNYFFRLTKYAAQLQQHIESAPDFILPEARRNEILGRIRTGLQDVPVSRAVKPGETGWEDWGVLMPDDPGHRVYVWIEALCNYLTAVDSPERIKYWPAALHLMAKDIVWFHAVIWPAMLTALGRELPRTVYAHSYFVREGQKMSKSLGNFLDIDTIRGYIARFGADAFRYYLVTQGPSASTDADFSYARFVDVFNSDLANGIGNATSRVGNMVDKYFAGRLPSAGDNRGFAGHDWPNIIDQAVRSAIAHADRMDLVSALAEGTALVRKVDGYINATEPFKLAKKIDADPALKDELAAILYHCAEALRVASIILSPAIPESAAKLWATWQCQIPECHETRTIAHLCAWGGEHALKPGQTITKGEVLFMRADATLPEPMPIVE